MYVGKGQCGTYVYTHIKIRVTNYNINKVNKTW